MRTRSTIHLAAGVALLAVLVPAPARAQIDINPPLPNVLLLIDTSGSMENMTDGTKPEQAGASCTPGVPMPSAKMNRWASLLSVLTGSIESFSCYAQDRSSSAFLSEYTWNGVAPYDAQYFLPFHRVLSNGCTAGPGTMPAQWSPWPSGGIKYHPHSNPAATCAAPGWQQQTDGILDTFRDRVRFGLMTFDTLPSAGTGASGSSADAQSGMSGMWSYYLDWQGGGSPAKGNPPNSAPQIIEVGARNPAAPPWEGRLMAFGAPDAALADVRQSNDRIQEVLLATRPYGATPIAGMLTDARDFIHHDATHGSANDPFFQGGCRRSFILLLSDGEPNLDLRSECETGNGQCPFGKPHEIAHDLATHPDPNKRVKTYAVGFGLSSASNVDCKTLSEYDLTHPSGKCATATGALRACCTLGRIAFEGGTDSAYFVDDIGALKTALAQVLASITAGSTSRTMPVFASATTSTPGGAGAAGYQFVSSFDVPLGGALWTGNLERKRYVCDPGNNNEATIQEVAEDKGDSFDANVNHDDPLRPRRFFTVIGAKQSNGDIHSKRSIRPNLAADDGLGLYSGAATGGGTPQPGPAFATTLKSSPQALGIDPATPPGECKARLATTDGSTCAERLIRWEVGESNMPAVEKSRQKSPACPECSELGSIYHATPVTVGPPGASLRDESYSIFAAQQAKRSLMLYTATTDGQLHAFKVAATDPNDTFKVDSLANNELWSFLPPHVLPRILATYDQQAFLLDGAPVVRDVILQRTESQALAGGGDGRATWSTVLLAGGGAGGGFYYALDVTDPTAPKFLWQLATSADGTPLFGGATPTPAIATVALKDGASVKEVAVAILPGGSAPLKAGACARTSQAYPNLQPKGSFAPRAEVRCWGEPGSATTGPSRSLTIARLDTGEVLMSFRGATADGPDLGNRAKVAPFDSPITGVPVPFPAQVGQVADRIYVGDADGTLWRVDLTSQSPQQWGVELAWDAYAFPGDTAATGEPIQTPPVISTDALGDAVILFSTGDQEMFTASDVETRVWSITEKPQGTSFTRTENWVIPLKDGKRVTGPISLFDGVAYFATHTPPPGGNAACAYGYGSVWGVDYRKTYQEDPAHDPPLPPYAANPYPQARYECAPGPGCTADPSNPSRGRTYTKDQPPGTTVFGVAITQTPTCADVVSYSDPFFGPYSAFANVNRGKIQLVYQTGKGGEESEGAKTKTVAETIPPPLKGVRIDSWASIVE